MISPYYASQSSITFISYTILLLQGRYGHAVDWPGYTAITWSSAPFLNYKHLHFVLPNSYFPSTPPHVTVLFQMDVAKPPLTLPLCLHPLCLASLPPMHPHPPSPQTPFSVRCFARPLVPLYTIVSPCIPAPSQSQHPNQRTFTPHSILESFHSTLSSIPTLPNRFQYHTDLTPTPNIIQSLSYKGAGRGIREQKESYTVIVRLVTTLCGVYAALKCTSPPAKRIELKLMENEQKQITAAIQLLFLLDFGGRGESRSEILGSVVCKGIRGGRAERNRETV